MNARDPFVSRRAIKTIPETSPKDNTQQPFLLRVRLGCTGAWTVLLCTPPPQMCTPSLFLPFFFSFRKRRKRCAAGSEKNRISSLRAPADAGQEIQKERTRGL